MTMASMLAAGDNLDLRAHLLAAPLAPGQAWAPGLDVTAPGYSPASLALTLLAFDGGLNFMGRAAGKFVFSAPAPDVVAQAVVITLNGQYLCGRPVSPLPLVLAEVSFSCLLNVQAQS